MAAPADNTNRQTHGVYSVVSRGEDVLPIEKRNRLQELKAQLATEPGREEYRIELAATIAIICELGMSELQKANNSGRNIYDTNVIKILGSYQNALARLLATWPKVDSDPITAAIVLEALKKAQDDQNK